jgi:predicted GNAT family acetyltransferase
MAAVVSDNESEHRYEIHLDGQLAGFTEYRRHPAVIEFTHTKIEPRFQHHGLASQLISSALDSARRSGLQVIPFCPFVRGYIRENPDYLDLVPQTRRKDFDLPF